DARRGEAARLPAGRGRPGSVVGRAVLVAHWFGSRLHGRRRGERHGRPEGTARHRLGRRLQPGARARGGGTVTRGGAVGAWPAAGLGLVEVLVALGVLAVATAALLALQAAGLRATRAALVTEQLAAAAEAEARLAGGTRPAAARSARAPCPPGTAASSPPSGPGRARRCSLTRRPREGRREPRAPGQPTGQPCGPRCAGRTRAPDQRAGRAAWP